MATNSQSRVPRTVITLWAALALTASIAVAEDCGPVPYPGAAGPYDYVDPKFAWNLEDINQYHWDPAKRYLNTNMLHRGLAEIHYLLIRVPNHYPALFELGRIHQRNPGVVYNPAAANLPGPLEFPPTVECYFDRSFRYRPNDATLRMLFGMYYQKVDKFQESLEQYKRAERMDPDSSEIQYNLGLLYFDLKQYEDSVRHAQRAYELGYPLRGLRKKLTAVGAWPATGG